jgi:preprotein translocase subunit SecB
MKFRSSLSVLIVHCDNLFFPFNTVIVTKTVTVTAIPDPTNIPDPSRQALCKYYRNKAIHIDLAPQKVNNYPGKV